MNKIWHCFTIIASCFSLYYCSAPVITTKEGSVQKVQSFKLSEIEILEGRFKQGIDLNKKIILNYEPDRLLARFRIQAGLEPKAEAYGGWEGESLAGHTLGHHLSACAMMYQVTGDETFRKRANYIVDELAIVQEANGGQYLGAFDNGKRIFEEEVAKGEIRSQSFNLNGIWSPFYTHHKVMAGLRDVYRMLDNSKALEVGKNFGDWIGSIVFGLSDEKVQEMLNCEFGGVQETLADLYEDTQDSTYLKIARIFHHKAIIDPLTNNNDILPDKHANTQIPKLIAAARLYELTGNEDDRTPAEFFWADVVYHHSYVTGGNSNHEYFGQPDKLRNRLSNETTETCNVYNMLKLSRHLFEWEPRAEVADFYERALFNHILSAQHPESGKVIYNLSLEMGGYKEYQDPLWFTCCVGSGMETHSKYGSDIYYHNATELYASQFIASKLNWKEKGLTLTQQTSFPEEQGTQFTFHLETPQAFVFYLRYPHWAEQGIEIEINGKKQPVEGNPGSFLAIEREWSDGDQVNVHFPFSLRLEAMPDDENRIAIFYGPVVLAGDLGPVEDEHSVDKDYVPAIMSEDRDPATWLVNVEGEINTFKLQNVGRPRDIALKPFYQTHDRRYSIYFDLYNESTWEAHQAALKAEEERKHQLEVLTYDRFQPGDDQGEKDHQLKGKDLNRMDDFKGRKARGAERGGWMSFEMKVIKGQPMALVLEYWGGFTGSKTFDILVDGQKIATENITGKKDGYFLDIQYDIPEPLTAQKEKITIKLDPHEGHRAGPIFYARTIKR